MSFDVDDYEKAIVRIFYEDKEGKKIVIGTGFLVAPGYVVTCAHVVLQAMGITVEEDFSTTDAPLKQIIKLDFPIVNGDLIQAEVVAWRPYNIEKGDIAGLKLLTSPPQSSKPMPMIRCTCAQIQDQRHAVFGFANDNGDCTNAYKPKSGAAGARYQLRKAGDDPSDETIAGGFSGAPVWNYDRAGVIGMVATAVTPTALQQSKAFAIPEELLSPVIQELFARSLNDSIFSQPEAARRKIQSSIEAAFGLSDTDGDRTTSNVLLDRLLYLGQLPSRNWKQPDGKEIDRLTQFAMFLMVMDGLPSELVNQIEYWVKCRGFDFQSLYIQANRYRQDRQVSSAEAVPHLIVQINPDEQKAENIYVSIWEVANYEQYDPLDPAPTTVQNRGMAMAELPLFLEDWLQKESHLTDPMIHCFVARQRLGDDLDARETSDGFTLGSQYKLVMRIDLNQSPTGLQYHTRWRNKWKAVDGKKQLVARDIFVRSDCGDKKAMYRQLKSVEMAILENLACDRVGDVFQFITDKMALPIVLWVRQDNSPDELDRILDCSIINLPDRILEARLDAIDETCIGNHLSLVWEDPKIIPPTMFMPLVS